MKVKQAREEIGMSQAELASKMYTRQATISDIERGKKWARSVDLVYFSNLLNKPILFFIPEKYRQRLKEEELDPAIQELVYVAKGLQPQDLNRIVIQAKALVKIKHRNE